MTARTYMLILATLLCCTLFVRLGYWQLDRAAQKQLVDDQQQQRARALPLGLAQLEALREAERQWRPVLVSGQYVNDQVFLLDNAIRDGQVGYEVITPLTTVDGITVLINRGWVPGDASRERLPEVPAILGPVFVLGTYLQPHSRPPVPELADNGWPRRIQGIHWPRIEAALGRPVEHTLLRIDRDSPGALRGDWPNIGSGADRHRAYALQWFSFAVLLPILLTIAWYRGRRDGRSQQRDEPTQ